MLKIDGMKTLTRRIPRSVFIQNALRTPIGKFGGSLLALQAKDLATACLKELLHRESEAPLKVDFVLMGHARQAGAGPNTARQATIFSGLPESTPALTLNHACASGLSAIISGAEKIALGHAERVLCGGVESMSNTPYFLTKARWGNKMGHMDVIDGMHRDGFFCPMADRLMGATVEDFLVPQFKIDRSEQDEFALQSQLKAAKAHKEGRFLNETFKIVDSKTEKLILEFDEHPRPDTTLESLAKLPPVFNKAGTITAGNSSGITDGSAFLDIRSQKNSHTLAEIVDWEFCALDPKLMGLGPVACTQSLLSRQNLKIEDLELVELNEAFAAQVIACQRTLRIPESKLNVNGGAIALGHPIGATGARIVVTLTHELKKRGPNKLGLATLCVSGGQGVALLIRSL
jgi:acetyl-CoA C-acetyltransferase